MQKLNDITIKDFGIKSASTRLLENGSQQKNMKRLLERLMKLPMRKEVSRVSMRGHHDFI